MTYRLPWSIGMAVLQLPDLGQKMLPFAILLGGVFTFVRLSRITRTGGDPRRRRFGLGFPAAAADGGGVHRRLRRDCVHAGLGRACSPNSPSLEARYVKGEDRQLSVSINGLWLRQGDEHSNR